MNGIEPINLQEGIRSRLVQGVNGLTMHILESGYSDPSRPCVLLLHGFPELACSWRGVMQGLAEQGYHVVAPDQRGYGRTSNSTTEYARTSARSTCLIWFAMHWRLFMQSEENLSVRWSATTSVRQSPRIAP
ncbi:alpha/beta fold hydrolase [Ruegeria sp. SCP11]|uniref:alpha/beta fold hydrolase n=1 Tax=Ruegeria sp. SCP11 TaxID=3141378 RepID=UPI00333C9B7D